MIGKRTNNEISKRYNKMFFLLFIRWIIIINIAVCHATNIYLVTMPYLQLFLITKSSHWYQKIIRKIETFLPILNPVGWGCRIHQLHLCGRMRHHPQKSVLDMTKQSDGEAPIMLEIWGIQSFPLLPLLLGSLWPRVVVPGRVLSMSQIELFGIQTDYKQMIYAKFDCLK